MSSNTGRGGRTLPDNEMPMSRTRRGNQRSRQNRERGSTRTSDQASTSNVAGETEVMNGQVFDCFSEENDHRQSAKGNAENYVKEQKFKRSRNSTGLCTRLMGKALSPRSSRQVVLRDIALEVNRHYEERNEAELAGVATGTEILQNSCVRNNQVEITAQANMESNTTAILQNGPALSPRPPPQEILIDAALRFNMRFDKGNETELTGTEILQNSCVRNNQVEITAQANMESNTTAILQNGPALSPRPLPQDILIDAALRFNMRFDKGNETELTGTEILQNSCVQANTESNTTFEGGETTIPNNDLEMTALAIAESNTTFDGWKTTIPNNDLTLANHMSSKTRSDSVVTENEKCFVCPVCLDPLVTVPSSVNEYQKWMCDLRAVRKHCDKMHPEEYIWNACHTEMKTTEPLSVDCIIKSAFRNAAIEQPLPEDPKFGDSWYDVLMVMCARLCVAYQLIANGSSINQLIIRKKGAIKKSLEENSQNEIPEKLQLFDATAQKLTSDALRYVQDLVLKVQGAEEPDVIFSRNLPMRWNAYTNLRKRNLIELFFWDATNHRDLQLITDLPETIHFHDNVVADGGKSKSREMKGSQEEENQENEFVTCNVRCTVNAHSDSEEDQEFMSELIPVVVQNTNDQGAMCPVCGLNVLFIAQDADMTSRFDQVDRKERGDHNKHYSQVHPNEPIWNFLPKHTSVNLVSVEAFLQYTLEKAADMIKWSRIRNTSWEETRTQLYRCLAVAKSLTEDPSNRVPKSPYLVHDKDNEQVPHFRTWIKNSTKEFLTSLMKIVKTSDEPDGWETLSFTRINNLFQLFFRQDGGFATCKLICSEKIPALPQWDPNLDFAAMATLPKKGRKKISGCRIETKKKKRFKNDIGTHEGCIRVNQSNGSHENCIQVNNSDTLNTDHCDISFVDANAPTLGVGDIIFCQPGVRAQLSSSAIRRAIVVSASSARCSIEVHPFGVLVNVDNIKRHGVVKREKGIQGSRVFNNIDAIRFLEGEPWRMIKEFRLIDGREEHPEAFANQVNQLIAEHEENVERAWQKHYFNPRIG